MQYLHFYVVVFIALASTAFVYWSNYRHDKGSPYTTIRLGRLLHYRDKAKALDQFISKKINTKQLMERYDKIEEDKKKWKYGEGNH